MFKPLLQVNLKDIRGDIDNPFHLRMVINNDPGTTDQLEMPIADDASISDYNLNEVVDRNEVYEQNDVLSVVRAVTRPTANLDGTSFDSFFSTVNNKFFGIGFNVKLAPLGYDGGLASAAALTALVAKTNANIRKRQLLKQFYDLIPIRSGQVQDLSGSEPAHNKLAAFEQYTNENAYHTDMLWLAFILRRYNELVIVSEKISPARKVSHSITTPLRDNRVRSLMGDISDFIQQYGTFYKDMILPQLKWTVISPARTKNNLGSLTLIHPQVQLRTSAFGAGGNLVGSAISNATSAITADERNSITAVLEHSLQEIALLSDYTKFGELESLVLDVINDIPSRHKDVIGYYRNILNKSAAMQEKWSLFSEFMGSFVNEDLKVSPLLSRFMEWLPGIVAGSDGTVIDAISLLSHENDKIVAVDGVNMPQMDFGDYLETFDFSKEAVVVGDIVTLGMTHTLTGMMLERVQSVTDYLPNGAFWVKDQVSSANVWWDYQGAALLPIFEIGGTQSEEALALLMMIRDSFRMKFATAVADPGSVGDDNNFLFCNRENGLLYYPFALSNYSSVYPSYANMLLPQDIYANLGRKTFRGKVETK